MAIAQVTTRALIAVAVGAAAVTGLAGTASADGSSVQEQVNAQLRQYPGGVQTGPNEISYKGGKGDRHHPRRGRGGRQPVR